MREREAAGLSLLSQQATRLYPYFPDRYAFVRLARLVGAGMPVREVRGTPLGRLLDRPALRPVVARCGGVLRADDLVYAWPARVDTYRLSFGEWRGVQTTRGGSVLVLHLDLPRSWRGAAARVLGEVQRLGCHGHPHAADGLTLAWARVDVELGSGEALVEEIQSDAVRAAREWGEEDEVARFVRLLPRSVIATWAEATLAATLEVLQDDLGVNTVWYHTHEGGQAAKRIRGAAPPRSLYTDLPRRFGFVEVDEQPALLGALVDRERRRLAGVRFQRLAA